jgi:hypothetical protein
MLVPSMTLKEIKKEIAKDAPIVFRKCSYLEHDLARATNPHGKEKVVRFYDYLSKYKNNWLIRLELTRREFANSFMVYYYNEIGLAGIMVTPNDEAITYHTSHFFKRFNERLHLNLVTPKEIMRAFMNECTGYHAKKMEMISPGVHKMFCASESGYSFGIDDENNNYWRMNTFITHEMLKEGQKPLAEFLSSKMEKYLKDPYNFQM